MLSRPSEFGGKFQLLQRSLAWQKVLLSFVPLAAIKQAMQFVFIAIFTLVFQSCISSNKCRNKQPFIDIIYGLFEQNKDINHRTGIATIKRANLVSILNDIDIAPTIIRKIVPGPRIDETNITNYNKFTNMIYSKLFSNLLALNGPDKIYT